MTTMLWVLGLTWGFYAVAAIGPKNLLSVIFIVAVLAVAGYGWNMILHF